MRNKRIIVTHRGTNKRIKDKYEKKLIKAYKPHTDSKLLKAIDPDNRLAYFIDGKESVVWVSKGKPNLWNRIFSGMVGKRGEAYISFYIDKSRVHGAKGLKRLFPYSQVVIKEDVYLKEDDIVLKKFKH